MSSMVAVAPPGTSPVPRKDYSLTGAAMFVREWSDTPRILLVSMLAVWAFSMILLLLLNTSISRTRTAITTIGKETAPSIISAQTMKASMIRMDASAAQELLYGQAGSPEAEGTYEQNRQVVGNDLVIASKNISIAGEQELLQSLVNNMGLYDHYVAQVRVHNRNGDLPRAVEAMRLATALMQDKIVPATSELDRLNLEEFEAAYRWRQTTGQVFSGLAMVLGLGFLVGLIALMAYLGRKTPIRFSWPLLLSSLLVIFMIWRVVSVLGASGRDMRLARDDAFMSVHSLLQARADAYDANSDESLYLVPGFDKAAYEESFQRKAALLVDRPLVDQLTSAVPSTGANFKGRLGDAWRNITFPGEKEALSDALREWAWFVIADLHIRSAEQNDRHDAAVEWATGPALGDTPQAFKRFETAMDRIILINRQEFDMAINRALSDLDYQEGINTFIVFLIALLTWVSIWPRIREYPSL